MQKRERRCSQGERPKADFCDERPFVAVDFRSDGQKPFTPLGNQVTEVKKSQSDF